MTLWLLPALAFAHGLQPASLHLRAEDATRVAVTWRLPLAQGRPLPLQPRLPEGCEALTEPAPEASAEALTLRWRVACPEGLEAGQVRVEGLAAAGVEVALRIEDAQGARHALLRAGQPALDLARPTPGLPVADYLALGTRHVLGGADHLLFVLGLVGLIGRRWGRLAGTVTSFTLGHSLSLAAGALGRWSAPAALVEALIAASVLTLAVELAQPREGSWTRRWPQAVAGLCGLLHGLGFAGALGEVGLPPDEAPWALALFNLGVEAGQLGVIAAALALGASLGERPRLRRAGIYAMGAVAAWWTWTRSAALLG
ncbi:MAG: HupE/UreJ family protein [Alphaproteobacteria bacterium]|nr:HupE/UreJ family protein [Alphaproteobacteria bacterium]